MRIVTIGNIMLLLITMVGIVTGGLAINIDSHVLSVNNTWERFDAQRSEKRRALDVLYAELGYGGMIHNFKNLVLRRQLKHASQAQTRLGGAQAALDRYASLDVAEGAETEALDILRDTLVNYSKALDSTRGLIQQKISVEDIDKKVRIDDRPAFLAIDKLDEITRLTSKQCIEGCKLPLLTQIRHVLGYGGMIHHFKNFILRHDVDYLYQAKEEMLLAHQLLDDYQLFDINENEQAFIDVVRGVLNHYQENFNLAEKLIKENHTAEQIDAQVKIDDEPALSALNGLLRENVADGERDATKLYAALEAAHELSVLSLWGAVILSVLLIFSAFWLIRWRIVAPLLRLTQAMELLASDNLETLIPEAERKNEIGKMADALQVFKDNALKHQQTGKELRVILDNVADGIIVASQSGVILSANPASYTVFGYNKDELVGVGLETLIPKVHINIFDSIDEQDIGSTKDMEGNKKDGKVFPVELAMTQVQRQEGNLFIGMVRDVTERKRLERMKIEFVSTVSHELRTPLTSIMGSLGLVRGGAVGVIPEKAENMLNIAYNNVERLIRLINNILDTEKIESGNMEFNIKELDLTDLLEQSIEENKGFGERHGVSLCWQENTVKQSLKVQVDGDRLMQVMANLLSNAVKYSPEGGKVEIAMEDHKDIVKVKVIDYGPGVPLEFHNKIFSKFAQADSSDTRQKEGTGLGLTITKSIIEKHGGTIGFDSVAGEGAVFYFNLPVLGAASPSPSPSIIVDNKKTHRGRILICEDDCDVANLLQIILSQEGIDTDLASDAEEAKKYLLKNKYIAMTLDLRLPGKSGVELLQELRSEAATQDLPILVISVRASETKKELNGGVINIIDWMDKPIDMERLKMEIRKLAQDVRVDKPRILHVEDDSDIASVVNAMINDVAIIDVAKNLKEAKDFVMTNSYQLVILDLGLPDGSGENLLPALRKYQGKDIPVVVFSAQDGLCQESIDMVSETLVKSMTSNERLLESILTQIGLDKQERNK